jgi:nicotinamide phosphoribosyltransferase
MNIDTDNILLRTDGYKILQYKQYPPKTTKVFSYGASRGSKYTDKTLFAGLQYYLKANLAKPLTHADIDFAKIVLDAYGTGFNEAGWRYIVDKHAGIFPLRIRSLPEGTIVPTGTVLYTVENTDNECFWLVSYLETAILRDVWYMTTVATNSRLCKEVILEGLEKTSDNAADQEVMFKLHDFGARGVSSHESAGMGGLAHIINFNGSDTLEGIVFGMKYYDAPVSAFGIPASEHSTITSWGRNGEYDAYANMVEQFAKPGAIFACVSDSYNIYDAARGWATSGLLDKVKEKGAVAVIRPDSGDPMTVPIKIIEILMEEVGYTVNSKGFKVLPDHVRVIQGDGINRESLKVLVQNMIIAGLSLSNLAFGMGGGLLQHVNRDDLKFAQKCSAAQVAGVWRDVYKDPIDSPDKKSLRGRLTVIRDTVTGEYLNHVTDYAMPEGFEDAMVTVYENGIIDSAMLSLNQVRANSNK